MPSPAATIGDIAGEARDLGRDLFLRRYRAPRLIRTGVSGSLAVKGGAFRTVDERRDTATPSSTRIVPEAQVWVVEKRLPTFPDKITVGRADNNDIVIVDPGVSKLQAYFLAKGTEFLLADAGSRNGTTLDLLPLTAMAPRPVSGGQVIGFGHTVSALFCTSEILWQLATSNLVR
ncbi:MAG: FHA domain-containing protein [Planctomycetales bacterium]|nr:FHA domain-containing protein [Planctomycetales bacterium]